MVLPEEAGIGLTPAKAANAASERTRPGWDQARETTAAVTGPMPVLSSRAAAVLAVDQIGHLVVVGREFVVEGEDPFGQPDGLGAGGAVARSSSRVRQPDDLG